MSDSSTPASTEGVAQHVGNVDGLSMTLSLCLCYTLCFACLRVYIRWRAYGPDDLVVLLSTVLALTFFGCGYVAIHTGLGRPARDLIGEPQSTIDRLNHATLSGNITWAISLCLSKAAIVTIFMRTSQTPSHRRLQYAALATIALQCIASIVLLTAACSPGNGLLWDFQLNTRNCPKQSSRWDAITGLDIATEILLLILPVHLIWKLHMSLRTKVVVVTAFWMRIPTIIFASFRSLETHELTTSTNTLLDAAIVVVWQAIELSYSLMAVTIAALKSFTENLNTGFGHGELVRVHGNSQAYKMSDLSAGSKTAKSKGLTATVGSIGILEQPRRPPPTATAKPERDDMKLRPESAHTSATISSPGRRSMSHSYSVKGNADSGAADCNSDEHIIMQEIQYSIRFDEAPLCQDHP